MAVFRPLTVIDVEHFLDEARQRKNTSNLSPGGKLVVELHRHYPFRMRRLVKDMKWFEKQAAKRGVVLEDL